MFLLPIHSIQYINIIDTLIKICMWFVLWFTWRYVISFGDANLRDNQFKSILWELVYELLCFNDRDRCVRLLGWEACQTLSSGFNKLSAWASRYTQTRSCNCWRAVNLAWNQTSNSAMCVKLPAKISWYCYRRLFVGGHMGGKLYDSNDNLHLVFIAITCTSAATFTHYTRVTSVWRWERAG